MSQASKATAKTWVSAVDLAARIIAVLAVPMLGFLWHEISAQTKAITELEKTVASSMAVERATAEERKVIKAASHFHGPGLVGVTFCFPEVNR